MSKELVSLSAVSNKFLNNDNHINMQAVTELNDKINAILKGLPVVNAKGKPIKMPIPDATYTVKRRAKIVKFDSAANNRGDLNYLAKRALPVKKTRRLTDRGAIRNMAVLTVYPVDKMTKAFGEDPFAKLRKSIKEAEAAFEKHSKRADKTKESVKSEKTKIRDASNALFSKAISAFKKVLGDTDIDMDRDLVESSGMGGKTVLLKLDKDLVVSIGKSDMTKFKAARAKAAEGDDAPKKGFGAKKTVGTKKSKSTKEEKPAKKVKKVAKEEKKVKKVKKADKSITKKLKKKVK